jgi:hypothetical protein
VFVARSKLDCLLNELITETFMSVMQVPRYMVSSFIDLTRPTDMMVEITVIKSRSTG